MTNFFMAGIMKYFYETAIGAMEYIIFIIHYTQDHRLQWNMSMKLPLQTLNL